ncbi:Predicted kinase, aminoglycoside phosphotransferase (APT) family [Lentibacillus halodurans]|uniref:Predicted kinase, aminoglycoside phosphotransferase (APT) family n=1 Tax=Lentibacillus halodurans TaxID=237679 RepID=A0A1I0YFF5_9BACI|nr:phosphotransferase family protein [Lentibacillus halodurans]SFB11931.1 Predicted kinase, aminoglycoside phosphotransferase (APT) family [Lentibacillus halodurans]
MTFAFNDTIQVRKGEELNKESLQRFLKENIGGVPDGSLKIRQFGTGHSNLTYLLNIGEWEAVLRRPPIGPVAPKAHDMGREYAVLSGLHPYYPTAPKPYIYSDDEDVIGNPFFIMERRKGIVIDSEFPEHIKYDPSLGRKISGLMVDKLVELHQIDYTKTKLANMSKPDGFMNRQVTGWINRYERARTDDIGGVDQLMNWLEGHIPVSLEPAIIHYDYKLNNAMFSKDFSAMTGLFDWEMTTVGDPLADVGAALSYWIQADDPDELKKGLGKPPATIKDGFFTRREFLEDYARKSGRDVSNINFYLTFAYFKLAVICQQIYYRYARGQTDDPRFARFNQFVANLIQYALYTIKGV